MKVLLVWPACTFSVWDVARGYRGALGSALGEENIKDYFYHKHVAYHTKAIPEEFHNEVVLSKHASETILNEALYFEADLVVIVSGLNVHPIILWSLHKVGIPTVAILTESPYEDDSQAEWVVENPDMTVVTTEKISEVRGWEYIPHAYDPAIHKSMLFDESLACDVLMVGTGWSSRQKLLEGVDWTGINLKLFGLWNGITKNSPLHKFYNGMSTINNEKLPKYYSSTKVCLNMHRPHPQALSMNPRAYEVAACGSYQICDKRQGVIDLFGDCVPTVNNSAELEHEIRWALSHEKERKARAEQAKQLIQPFTFDLRVRQLLDVVSNRSTSYEDSLGATNGVGVRGKVKVENASV